MPGTQTIRNPHFAPSDCVGLCIDMIAAGVLDYVVIRTDDGAHMVARQTTASGCKSNLFGRKHQGRDFRLELAGYCMVATALPDTPSEPFVADVTFLLTNDIPDSDFQLRQAQAYDKSGKLLFQQSEVKWVKPTPEAAQKALSAQSSPPPKNWQVAGTSPGPFNWPQIATLLGLRQNGLQDLSLDLPSNTDPARIIPPDVSFRMLELLAVKDAMTQSERLVFVALMLQPAFYPTELTPTALKSVLKSAPEHGGPIASALVARVLQQIAQGTPWVDPEWRATLLALRRLVPPADCQNRWL